MTSKGPLKFSGLVQQGRITVPADAKPSSNFDRVESTPPDNLVDGREYMISLANLVDSPYQTRLKIDPARVDELGAQLTDQGQQDAVEFRRGKAPGTFELIKGHTRKRAATSIGWTEVRGLFRDLSDRDAEIACMVDNTGKTPSEFEYAHSFQRAMAAGYATTQAAVGRMFGFSQGTVSKALAMLQLPAPVLSLLNEHPQLFGVRTAAHIQTLWEKHAGYEHIIMEGIGRLSDGMDQMELPKWVDDQVAKIKRQAAPAASKAPPPQARRQAINSDTGSECYVTILKEKAIVIEFKDFDIPKEETQAAVNKALADLIKARKDTTGAK